MWENYTPSKPLPVEGGIKSHSRKGEFTKSWWGKRWIDALESFEDAKRLTRGRSYARKGQVLDIHVSKGSFSADVQGSRKEPYQVTIEMEELSESAWQLVLEALAKKAIYTAELLAGKLPQDIEVLFQEVRVPLLPSSYADLSTDCSCPDWSNPCKHVAAVLYLLAEELDRDPFLLFHLRGMERETFLNKLEALSFDTSLPIKKELEKAAPLSSDPETFWTQGKIDEEWLTGGFEKPPQEGTLLKSLGKFPFWRGEKDLPTALAALYKEASRKGLELLDPKD